jgi:hypothetical protein
MVKYRQMAQGYKFIQKERPPIPALFSPLFLGLVASSLCAKVPGYNSQLFKPIYSKVAFEPTSPSHLRKGMVDAGDTKPK